MKLLTNAISQSLPPLRAQADATDPIVHVKFFTPDSSWTWYVTEGAPHGDDFLFFGYVEGLDAEWGYFLLSELEGVRGHLGLPVERDLYFERTPISAIHRRS
jgi:Protein of unknown function (DUF2958)